MNLAGLHHRIAELEELVTEMASSIQDAHRRLANVVRTGRVVEVNKDMAKVAWGKDENDQWVEGLWMPWTTRAGTIKDWSPPTAGEQVLIFSPNGHIGPDSWAMPGGYSSQFKPNHDQPGERKINVGANTEMLFSGDGITLRTRTFTVQADQINLRGQRIDHDQRPLAQDPPKPEVGEVTEGVPTS